MHYQFEDFNSAELIFDGPAKPLWDELHKVLSGLPLFLQPSDQAGKQGEPIFDPKATNAHLTHAAAGLGWHAIPVPKDLIMFGKDWDGGKGNVLAEWQFSNYPFLWNNVIRTEAIHSSQVTLPGMAPIDALVVVTKCGEFPASNSTLYYEQACAQLHGVTRYNTFSIPIRMVGLTVGGASEVSAEWCQYPGRYSRAPASVETRNFSVVRRRAGMYDFLPIRFLPVE